MVTDAWAGIELNIRMMRMKKSIIPAIRKESITNSCSTGKLISAAKHVNIILQFYHVNNHAW